MARYFLGTNHLSAALNASSNIRERIFQARLAGHRFGTCVPVLRELETGLLRTRRLDQNRRILAVLLREVRIWPLEPSIAPLHAEIYHDLRDRGRALSQVDMLLAALARSLNATHLTSDHDFDALNSVRVEI